MTGDDAKRVVVCVVVLDPDSDEMTEDIGTMTGVYPGEMDKAVDAIARGLAQAGCKWPSVCASDEQRNRELNDSIIAYTAEALTRCVTEEPVRREQRTYHNPDVGKTSTLTGRSKTTDLPGRGKESTGHGNEHT